jgi:hypothetical protein
LSQKLRLPGSFPQELSPRPRAPPCRNFGCAVVRSLA